MRKLVYQAQDPGSGFTLIEVLIVIFIISIVTSVALLTISRNENRRLEAFGKEFVERLTLAEEEAMLRSSVIGLHIKENNYQYLNFETAAEEKKSSWQPLQDELLHDHEIPSDMELSLEGVEAKSAIQSEGEISPQLVISTNGDITPFTIHLGKKGQSPRYLITGYADGSITIRALS